MNRNDEIEWLNRILDGVVDILENVKSHAPESDRAIIENVIHKARKRYYQPPTTKEGGG